MNRFVAIIASSIEWFLYIWPSRQSRKRCIQSKTSDYSLHRVRVEFGANATPTGSRWISNNHITRCHRQFELVGVSFVAVRGDGSRLPAGGLSPRDPRLSSLAEWERGAAKDRGTWGQYVAVCSVPNSPLTYNPFATLSNSVRGIFCLKKCVRSSLPLILFLHVYV